MISISIITVTYNAAATIADCLQSVSNQTYTPAEHIIIDGASTDNTLEIVKSLRFNIQDTNINLTPPDSPLTRIISEPDNGIYDAMNKGIAQATGDIIAILNADDFYASSDVLAKVAKVFENPAVMSCYGDLQYIKERKFTPRTSYLDCAFKVIRYWKSGIFSPEKFYWGWMPPHPTFFVRKSVYEKYGIFRLDLGTAADYELMLRFLLKERISNIYIPEVLVRMRTSGVSNVTLAARIAANRMDCRAWEVNGLVPYPWTVAMKPLRKLPQWIRT